MNDFLTISLGTQLSGYKGNQLKHLKYKPVQNIVKNSYFLAIKPRIF